MKPSRTPFVFTEGSSVAVADIEADGLLDDVSRIWCVVIRDYHSGEIEGSYGPDRIREALDHLNAYSFVLWHNGIRYDLEVIHRLYPGALEVSQHIDTMVWSRLVQPDTKRWDAEIKARNPQFPGRLVGSHSLEAWGWRLGVYKRSFGKTPQGDLDEAVWKQWTPEMQSYCEQDTDVTLRLARWLQDQKFSAQSIGLEHEVAHLCARIEQNGFHFNKGKAVELYARLKERRGELEGELKATFGSWYVPTEYDFVPRRDNRTSGYVRNVPLTKVKLVEFNPSSRQHIAKVLRERYGWKPSSLTPSGQPVVDEQVLKHLDWPEAKLLTEYFLLDKRIGQLAEGNNAWLKLERDGYVCSGYLTNGAVTGRAIHKRPNIAQTPGNDAEWGRECRELFDAPPGWVLVGCDLSKLEFMVLGHYLAPFDGGSYGNQILEEDPHSVNQRLMGFTERKPAKTVGYAVLYGEGNWALGQRLPPDEEEAERLRSERPDLWEQALDYVKWKRRKYGVNVPVAVEAKGAWLRERMMSGIQGLDQLQAQLEKRVKTGYLIGLDGRRITIRKRHAALNFLLQGGGAVVCKEWITLTDRRLRTEEKLRHGRDGDYFFSAWVHDEVQVASRPECAAVVKEVAIASARDAGEALGLRVPIGAEGTIGQNWSETH